MVEVDHMSDRVDEGEEESSASDDFVELDTGV